MVDSSQTGRSKGDWRFDAEKGGFVVTSSVLVHLRELRGLGEGGPARYISQAYSPRSTERQVANRLSQVGGSFNFPVHRMSREQWAALYLYLGASTFAFDSNPGLRASPIRIVGRRMMQDRFVAPLSSHLNLVFPGVEVDFEIGPVDLGSVIFAKKIRIWVGIGAGLTTIAAGAPQVWENTRDIYAPALAKIASEASGYVGNFIEDLRALGIDVKTDHEFPAQNIRAIPPADRRREEEWLHWQKWR